MTPETVIPDADTTAMASACPVMIVSPYARPDTVMHEVLDHTSVLRLLQDKSNLPYFTRRAPPHEANRNARPRARLQRFLHPPLLRPPTLGSARPPYQFAELPRR